MKRLAFLLFLSCVDPVHDEEVDALGPEAPGVKEGPLHRPGQPCTVCHGSRGPGEPELSIGGTIYAAWNSDQPAAGATVLVIDARDRKHEMKANSVGNFYAEKDEYDPVYPLRVEIAFGGTTEKMETLVRRDGGCGACHRANGDGTHTVRIYAPGKGP